MIAKCQRSLETTEPEGTQLLIYNRTREWVWTGAITEEWNALFGPTLAAKDNRFFAEVQWQDGRTPPRFVCKVPEQNWPQRTGDVWITENRGEKQ